VTDRIVTKEDAENVLAAVEQAYRSGGIDSYHCLNYKAIVLFGAFTGQRPLATIARLTVGQFREAVKMDKPVIDVLPWQDKIRMQHYCPLHPQVVDALLSVLDDRRDNELVFEQLSFQQWLRFYDIRLLRSNVRMVNGDLRKFCEQRGDIIGWNESNRAYILTHEVRLLKSNFRIVMGDLRKFAEQYGDIIQWNQSNRSYIMTHGVSEIDWKHYKHPLPEHVYDVYMQYWRDVELSR
jgi:hypothetical protein